MENQENIEQDNLKNIQDRMNGVDKAKRKSVLIIFAVVCVSIMILRLVLSFGATKDKAEGKDTEQVKVSEIESDQQKALEFSLERKRKMDGNFEEILDKWVEEDRKANEVKDGKEK